MVPPNRQQKLELAGEFNEALADLFEYIGRFRVYANFIGLIPIFFCKLSTLIRSQHRRIKGGTRPTARQWQLWPAPQAPPPAQ